jgi:hypothetical protein
MPKMSEQSPARRRLRRVTMAGLSAALVVGALAGSSVADAGRPRPRPLPAPSAPVVVDVIADDATTARFGVTNPFESGVETVVRTIVGPCQSDAIFACGPQGSVDVTGAGRISGLQPDSVYTVSVERVRFFDTRTNRAVNLRSAPTTFTVRTLTLDAARPSAPQIRETGQRDFGGRQFVTIDWAPSTDTSTPSQEIRYVYRIAQDPLGQDVPTCSQYCFGTTGAAIPVPAPGTSITVTVTAIDAAGNRSLSSNALTITR